MHCTVSRAKLLPLIAKLSPCLIGMEACSGSHEWVQRFRELGHAVRLMAPKFVVALEMVFPETPVPEYSLMPHPSSLLLAFASMGPTLKTRLPSMMAIAKGARRGALNIHAAQSVYVPDDIVGDSQVFRAVDENP